MSAVFEEESTVRQWDNDYYHPISEWLYDTSVAAMLRALDMKPGDTVLDAGCGPGVHSIRAAKSGFNVSAIDISETMLTHAKQRAEAAGVSRNIQFQRQDLTQLTFADNSFRNVFSWGVIIHIPELEQALNELCRIVELGGKLALYLTNSTAIDHKIESCLRFLLRKPLVGVQQLPLGDGIWYHMSGEKLWVWRIRASGLIRYMADRGFVLKHRRIGELTEIQRRVSGLPRRMLLRLNNAAYRMHVPASFGCANLFVFEKHK